MYWVYIVASGRNGTLYVGVTNDLVRRVWEHRNAQAPGFSAKHKIHILVYFEPHPSIEAAIQREKRVKRWRRDWNLRLIEETNPQWKDLWPDIAEP